jgi:hypothetical protein
MALFPEASCFPAGLRQRSLRRQWKMVFLTLTIPKAEQVKPKAIKVKAKEKPKEKKRRLSCPTLRFQQIDQLS